MTMKKISSSRRVSMACLMKSVKNSIKESSTGFG
jgi:hypothetical protein